MDEVELTTREEKAISELKAIAKRWPKSLWLFSASGTLLVMKKDSDGNKRYNGESVAREAIVDYIHIENDGGDF